MTPDEISRVRDTIESEVLLDPEIEVIHVEAAWCCGCPEGTEKWAVADANRPIKFGFCPECCSAAIVTVWGS